MSLIEVNNGSGEPDNFSLKITSWDALRADHRQHPEEYQVLLEMVPSWGQELLVGLHAHHPDSFSHSLRVAAIIDSVLEGRHFGGISPEEVTLAALLHDVGKEGIPLGLLDKNGPLTDGEREKVKPHALQSFVAIEPHDLLVAQLAGGHHLFQRDPYGHDGAKGVPWDATVGQQLIAVADAVDALASARSYKPALPKDEVRTTLLRERSHSPFLINRVIDARFAMPSFDIVPQDTGMQSLHKTMFTT